MTEKKRKAKKLVEIGYDAEGVLTTRVDITTRVDTKGVTSVVRWFLALVGAGIYATIERIIMHH